MKKIAYLLLLIPILNYSQIKFEPGYFIDNENIKTSCLIKNVAWENNPEEIDYKLEANSETNKKNISQIKEFGVNNSYIYKRFTTNVEIYESPNTYLVYNKEPVFEEKTIFLQLLVSGNANLYQYIGINRRLYFFSLNDSPEIAKQLVYKEYKINAQELATNNYFKQQLFVALKKDNLSEKDFESLNYYTNDLIKLFEKYNDITSINYAKKTNKLEIIYKANLGFENIILNNEEFGEKISSNVIKLGLGAEIILPFNQKKWGIAANINYQGFNKETSTFEKKDITTSPNPTILGEYIITKTTNYKYSYLEVPIYLKHYLFINNNSKINLNFGVNLCYTFNSKINYSSQIDKTVFSTGVKTTNYLTDEQKLDASANIMSGIGYNYKKYSIDLIYNMHRIPFLSTVKINSIGVVFSYKFK